MKPRSGWLPRHASETASSCARSASSASSAANDADADSRPSSAARRTGGPCGSRGPRARTRPGGAPPRRRSRSRRHAEPRVALELLLRRAEHRETPAVRLCDAPELGEQRVELLLVADRVAADQRGAGDDAIREERAPGRREEVALVAAEREEREAVAAVGVDERARDAALADRLRAPRATADAARGRARRTRRRKPSAVTRSESAIRQVDAAQVDADDDRRDGDSERAETEQRSDRCRIARHVEALAVARAARRAVRARSSPPRRRAPSRGARPRTSTMTVTASCHARCRRRASDRASQTSAIPNASAPTRAAVGIPGGSTPWTIRNRSAYSGVSDEIDADDADGRSRPGEQRLGPRGSQPQAHGSSVTPSSAHCLTQYG